MGFVCYLWVDFIMAQSLRYVKRIYIYKNEIYRTAKFIKVIKMVSLFWYYIRRLPLKYSYGLILPRLLNWHSIIFLELEVSAKTKAFITRVSQGLLSKPKIHTLQINNKPHSTLFSLFTDKIKLSYCRKSL